MFSKITEKLKSIVNIKNMMPAFIVSTICLAFIGFTAVNVLKKGSDNAIKEVITSSSKSSKSFSITQSDPAESSSSSSAAKSKSTNIDSLYKQFDNQAESEANHSKELASKQAQDDQKIKDNIQSAENAKIEADRQAGLAREAQQRSAENHSREITQSETNASTANALKALQETNQSQTNHLKELESQTKQSQATSSSASSANNSKNN